MKSKAGPRRRGGSALRFERHRGRVAVPRGGAGMRRPITRWAPSLRFGAGRMSCGALACGRVHGGASSAKVGIQVRMRGDDSWWGSCSIVSMRTIRAQTLVSPTHCRTSRPAWLRGGCPMSSTTVDGTWTRLPNADPSSQSVPTLGSECSHAHPGGPEVRGRMRAGTSLAHGHPDRVAASRLSAGLTPAREWAGPQSAGIRVHSHMVHGMP